MERFLSEEEKKDFLDLLRKNNLDDGKELAKRFYTSETTISTNLTRFQRKKERKKNGKVPRIWKDLIELQVENKELREKLEKVKKVTDE